MLSFNFGNKNSFEDYGILIAKRPVIPSPKRRVTFVNVPGRDSNIKFDEGTYEDINIVVECTVKDRNNLSEKLDEIKGWLFNSGESELIFSFQDDRKYTAQVINAIDFKPLYKIIGVFPILFSCRPFKYEVTNSMITIQGSGGTINNVGTVESEPIISVYGSGNITLSINNDEIQLRDVSNSITIDSVIEDCYGNNNENLNVKMAGEFPRLIPGINTIRWTGSISKLEIIPNWRWL